MKGLFPLAAVGLGVLLLVLSAVWGFLFPSANQWTPERAKEMSILQDEVHTLIFKAAAAEDQPYNLKGENPAEVQAEYRDKKARLEGLKKDFESIQDSPQTTASYLRWTGIGLVVVGAIGVKMAGD